MNTKEINLVNAETTETTIATEKKIDSPAIDSKLIDEKQVCVDLKSSHKNKLFTLVNASVSDSVKIDTAVNIASLFKLDSVDIAILSAIYTMSDTNCRTFEELKAKSVKALKSGIAVGNKLSNVTVSYYKWKDLLTDDRIKKSVMLLSGLFSGYHITVNKAGQISVQKSLSKETLLSAKFYRNESKDVVKLDASGMVVLKDGKPEMKKETTRIYVEPRNEIVKNFGKALENLQYGDFLKSCLPIETAPIGNTAEKIAK